jgi:hypothetical protein
MSGGPGQADGQVMVGTIIGTATAAAAAAAAIAGHAIGTSPAAVTMSPFGGSVPVHIGRVGRIEVDLGSSSASGLRRVKCASGPAQLACYVAP